MTSLANSLAVFLALFSSSTTSAFSLSPYELFDDNGFPLGLLPEGISDYEVDESAGTFSIHFKEDCLIKLQSSSVFLMYDGTVQGNISCGEKRYSGLIEVFAGLTIILNTGQKTEVTEIRIVYGVIIISGRNGPVWSFERDNLVVSPQCGPDCILISCDNKKPSLALQSD